MKLHFRLITTFFFLLSILGICGVQQNDDNILPTSAPLAANMSVPGLQAKDENREKPCPTSLECSELPAHCLSCTFNETCVYGRPYNVTCTTTTDCIGEKVLEKTMVCRYCYQTEHWEHTCIQKANCNSVASPRAYYRTNCSVKDNVICLGKRKFYKNLSCNWTGGYRWSTALILSITLGGFGADRFYLGHWQEGIGKLFSFGGLGIWTLIDVILIALHYLGPADGSLYL